MHISSPKDISGIQSVIVLKPEEYFMLSLTSTFPKPFHRGVNQGLVPVDGP